MRKTILTLGIILIAIIITPLFFGKWFVSICIFFAIILFPFVVILLSYLILGSYLLYLKLKAEISTRKVRNLAKEIAKEQIEIQQMIKEYGRSNGLKE